jgi:hypothetical protein
MNLKQLFMNLGRIPCSRHAANPNEYVFGALALKTSIIEGGALYTLKITNWDELFTVNG